MNGLWTQTLRKAALTLAACMMMAGCQDADIDDTAIDTTADDAISFALESACLEGREAELDRCVDGDDQAERCAEDFRRKSDACRRAPEERPNRLPEDADERPEPPISDGDADEVRCPNTARYCRAACAGADLPEVPDNCPQPSCDCDAPEEEEEDESLECRQQCGEHARALYDGCVARGHDPQRCRSLASDAAVECVEDRCEVQPNEPLDCATNCGQVARQAYRRCVDQGGDQDECARRARSLHERCVDRCETEDEVDVDGEDEALSCRRGCHRRTRAIYAQCVDAGNRPAACRERASSALTECLERRCGEVDEGVDSCATDCGHAARRAHRACTNRGGAEERCGGFARRVFQRCVASCGDESPQGERPERPEGERPERPEAERPERPEGERPERPEAKRPERPEGERPERPEAERPDRPEGERPERPEGERPERPEGERPERPEGERPERPEGERPEVQEADDIYGECENQCRIRIRGAIVHCIEAGNDRLACAERFIPTYERCVRTCSNHLNAE